MLTWRWAFASYLILDCDAWRVLGSTCKSVSASLHTCVCVCVQGPFFWNFKYEAGPVWVALMVLLLSHESAMIHELRLGDV